MSFHIAFKRQFVSSYFCYSNGEKWNTMWYLKIIFLVEIEWRHTPSWLVCRKIMSIHVTFMRKPVSSTFYKQNGEKWDFSRYSKVIFLNLYWMIGYVFLNDSRFIFSKLKSICELHIFVSIMDKNEEDIEKLSSWIYVERWDTNSLMISYLSFQC